MQSQQLIFETMLTLGCLISGKQRIAVTAVNESGVRATVRVLMISPIMVIETFKEGLAT